MHREGRPVPLDFINSSVAVRQNHRPVKSAIAANDQCSAGRRAVGTREIDKNRKTSPIILHPVNDASIAALAGAINPAVGRYSQTTQRLRGRPFGKTKLPQLPIRML